MEQLRLEEISLRKRLMTPLKHITFFKIWSKLRELVRLFSYSLFLAVLIYFLYGSAFGFKWAFLYSSYIGFLLMFWASIFNIINNRDFEWLYLVFPPLYSLMVILEIYSDFGDYRAFRLATVAPVFSLLFGLLLLLLGKVQQKKN